MAHIEEDQCDDVARKLAEKYNRRRVLAQVFASAVTGLQYFSLGAALGFATVEIAGLQEEGEIIKTNENDLSWIGSICFITQASGNLLGGPITTIVGRKKAMIYSNIPYIMAWIMMWQAQDLPTLMVGNAFVGLGTGLLSAPMTSYIGEICQPSLRGIMASSAEVFVSVGVCGVFILGTVCPWRILAAVYLGVAVFSMFAIIFVPESPIWLLSKGREEHALRSLCWLRGWVEPPFVEKEFQDLISYNNNNQRCRRCESAGNEKACPHENEGTWKRIKGVISEFKRREARRPLILSSLLFTFSSMTGLTAIKPTMINLVAAFNVPLDPHWTVAMIGALTVLGAIVCMCLVRVTGKKFLVVSCMLGSCLSTFALGFYAHTNISPDVSSFEEVTYNPNNTSALPLIFFIAMVSFNHIGVIPVSWMIISEIFPYSIRGIACGIVGAVCDLSGFIAAKTYLYVESSMHIYGSLYFYSVFTFIGAIYLYLFFLETENRSVAEIEATFALKNKTFYADDYVARKIKGLFGKESAPATIEREMVALNQK